MQNVDTEVKTAFRVSREDIFDRKLILSVRENRKFTNLFIVIYFLK